MKRKDTASYKVKACAVSILLCSLFAVLAVGCSNQEADNPENTSQYQSGNLSSKDNGTADKITLPTDNKITLPKNDSTGSFSGGRPTEPGQTTPGHKLTMGEITLVPFTRPEAPKETTSTAATVPSENTDFSFDISVGTIPTGSFFVIGEDTTPTAVHGFNG